MSKTADGWRNAWVRFCDEPLDRGDAGRPAFPYKQFIEIRSFEDAKIALSSDGKRFIEDLTREGFESLLDVIRTLNQPDMLTTHAISKVDEGSTYSGEFQWAKRRAFCSIIVMPRHDPFPSLGDARELMYALVNAMKRHIQGVSKEPPGETGVLLRPIVMKLGTPGVQPMPTLGFGVQIVIAGFAGNASRASQRCASALKYMTSPLA